MSYKPMLSSRVSELQPKENTPENIDPSNRKFSQFEAKSINKETDKLPKKAYESQNKTLMSGNESYHNKVSALQAKNMSKDYEASVKNRLNRRVFSVYKILEPNRAISTDVQIYVDDYYVENQYIEIVNKFNPL